jgi:hypothetical protein
LRSLSDILILVGGGLFILLALWAVWQAVRSRSQSTRKLYGVGRVEAHKAMQIALLRGAFFLILGLILLAVFGLSLRPDDLLPSDPAFTPRPSRTPTLTAQPTATVTPVASIAVTEAGPQPSATSPLPSATPSPLPSATPLPSARVNSEVGLYLRDVPGGTAEVELLANGTLLILLPGRETVDGAEWQQVRTPSGNEGWVAVAFIIYQ